MNETISLSLASSSPSRPCRRHHQSQKRLAVVSHLLWPVFPTAMAARSSLISPFLTHLTILGFLKYP